MAFPVETLHPLVVHFPIALIVVSAGLEATRAVSGSPTIGTVRTLMWIALVGVVAAYWTGHEEFEAIGVVSPQIESALGAHENAAKGVLWSFPIAILLLELGIRAPAARWPIWGFRIVLGIALSLVALAGLRGGELVYTHGIGTACYSSESLK